MGDRYTGGCIRSSVLILRRGDSSGVRGNGDMDLFLLRFKVNGIRKRNFLYGNIEFRIFLEFSMEGKIYYRFKILLNNGNFV